MQALRWKSQFFTIWTGQAVSLITSAILQMAIILYLTETTGSALILSLASLVGFLPYAVLGPFIGVLVDRYNRKHIMILSDLVIALAAAILALAALSGELPVWLVMVILFVRSVGTAFHTPSLSAVTPLLVPQDMLAKCAGYSQAIQSVSLLLSPALAAFLYMAWNLTAVIALDVAGAVIASLTVAWVKIPGLTKPQQTEPLHFFKEMKEGFLALRSNKGLFALLWIGFLFTFIYMPINALFPLMSMEHFEGTAFHVSVVEIAFALGMLAGGLALGALGALKNRYLMIAASIARFGCLGAASSLWFPPLCCKLSGHGICGTVLCRSANSFGTGENPTAVPGTSLLLARECTGSCHASWAHPVRYVCRWNRGEPLVPGVGDAVVECGYACLFAASNEEVGVVMVLGAREGLTLVRSSPSPSPWQAHR
jgi:DHA3 family macrolide efflux protein-like MFS transporter